MDETTRGKIRGFFGIDGDYMLAGIDILNEGLAQGETEKKQPLPA